MKQAGLWNLGAVRLLCTKSLYIKNVHVPRKIVQSQPGVSPWAFLDTNTYLAHFKDSVCPPPKTEITC